VHLPRCPTGLATVEDHPRGTRKAPKCHMGGAIALASSLLLLRTRTDYPLVNALKHRSKRYCLQTMCRAACMACDDCGAALWLSCPVQASNARRARVGIAD